ARNCAKPMPKRISTRSAASSSCWPAGCRAAARSFPIPAASPSRCSMPTRGGSSGCAYGGCRARPLRPRPRPTPRQPRLAMLGAMMTEAPASLEFEAAATLDPVQRFAAWTSTLTGWRRQGFAALLGVLAAAALPPVDMVPLLVVSFSGLVWLAADLSRPREAFVLGWSFGFGFFLAGFYWIALALLVDIAAYWWLLPLAIVALPV